MAVFPLYYAGNLAYYQSLLVRENVLLEQHEYFPKQTFRNRMEIMGPNGIQKLVIPTEKTRSKRTMHDVSISYAENWQKDHWKGLEAAYRRSPYFEFYQDRFKPFYFDQSIHLLWDFNKAIFDLLNELLGLQITYKVTESYKDVIEQDQRSNPFTLPTAKDPYLQVFSDRHPFHGNLSILDALFNLGPQAKDYLLRV